MITANNIVFCVSSNFIIKTTCVYNYSSIATYYQGHTDFSSQFCDKIFELNLEQLVDKPTHINGNILDVVLANFIINQPTVSDAHPQCLSSDHFIINFSVPTSSHTVEQKASYVA